MAFVFRTPPARELPRTLPERITDRFWARIRAPFVGACVLKQPNGSYQTVSDPSPEQIKAATKVYWGGHVYDVDEDEAASLEAAGYTITEE